MLSASPSKTSIPLHVWLTQPALHVILKEATAGANRLVRSLGLQRDHRDDLAQELLLDLLTRLRSFDPERGGLGPFAGTIVAHRASRIAKRLQREARCIVYVDPHVLSQSGRSTVSPHIAVEQAIDRDRMVGRFGGDCLTALPVDQAAERDGKGHSTATLYRRRRNACLAMLMAGCPVAA